MFIYIKYLKVWMIDWCIILCCQYYAIHFSFLIFKVFFLMDRWQITCTWKHKWMEKQCHDFIYLSTIIYSSIIITCQPLFRSTWAQRVIVYHYYFAGNKLYLIEVFRTPFFNLNNNLEVLTQIYPNSVKKCEPQNGLF